MLSKFNNFIHRIEQENTPLVYWILALFSIISIRNFIEVLLEVDHALIAPGSFLLTLPLSYAALFISLLLLLKIITKEKSANITKFLVVLFLLLLIVPPIDYLVSSGEGYRLEYLSGDASYLSNEFISFYGSGSFTIGQKIETVIFAALLLSYVLLKTKSHLKTLLAAISSYLVLFIWTSTPSVIYHLSNLFFNNPLSPMGVSSEGLIDKAILRSYISPPVITLVFTLLIIFELYALLFLSNRKKFSSVVAVIRPLRTLHYLLLASFGLLLGFSTLGPMTFEMYDFLFSISFLVSVFFIYQMACSANDYFDRDLYVRLGAEKSKNLSLDLRQVSLVFLIASLFISLSLGYASFLLLIIFSILAYLYSAPPIRLKKYPIIASFTLASWALFIVLAGFAVVAKRQTIDTFPPEIALMVLTVYTLGTNYKDLKDLKLDKKDKVYTIPVLLGEKKGRFVVSLLVSLSFLLVPVILGINLLIVPSIIVALFSLLIIQKQYSERPFRLMHLLFFIITAYFILIS